MKISLPFLFQICYTAINCLGYFAFVEARQDELGRTENHDDTKRVC